MTQMNQGGNAFALNRRTGIDRSRVVDVEDAEPGESSFTAPAWTGKRSKVLKVVELNGIEPSTS